MTEIATYADRLVQFFNAFQCPLRTFLANSDYSSIFIYLILPMGNFHEPLRERQKEKQT